MKQISLLLLIIFLIPGFVISQLSWEVSTAVTNVSSYRSATAVYTEFGKNYVLVFGGWTTSSGNYNESSFYDYDDDTWGDGWIIPENTRGGAAVNASNYVYLLTGNDGADNNINSQTFLRLEVPSATWEYLPDYPIAARYVAMTLNPNSSFIYCAGGSGDNYAAVDQVNVFNSWDNSWESCTSLPYPSSGGSALIFNGQHLYLMGGLINQPYDKVFRGLIDKNDPTIITWLPGASIPVEMAKISAGYIGNGLIIATDLTGTFMYDISQDIWELVDNKPIPVKGGNFASIEIDGIYNFSVAGGKDADDNLVDHVEYLSGEQNVKFPATFVLTMNDGEPAVNVNIEVAGFNLTTDEAGAAVYYLENGTYDYTASYDDLITSGTFVIDNTGEYISGELVVSINKHIQYVDIYPNPVRDKLNIRFGGNNITVSDVKIINVVGKLVYDSKVNSTADFIINVEHLTVGVYFLILSDSDQKQFIRKLIINR